MTIRKLQFLVNILFLLMLVVWLSFDFLNLFDSPLRPATHMIPEAAALFLLGVLFGSVKEVPYVWPLIIIILTSATIYGILDGHLLSILGFNLLLICSFLIGYVLQENKKIVKVEKT